MGDERDEPIELDHRVRIQGVQIARGVACTLITAGQAFSCKPIDGEDAVFEISVASSGVRFLPAVCRQTGIPRGK